MLWEQVNDNLEDKKIKLIIEKKDENKTVLEILASHLKYYNKERWEQGIEKKQVLITKKDKEISQNEQLKEQDEIILTIKNEAEPSVDKNIQTIYEDDYILVMNKTGNLPVHPSGRYYGNTLVNILKHKYPKIKIINRLDKSTSGIIIFAKDKDTAKDLAQQFSQRKVKKQYIAIVTGNVNSKQTIDVPIKESTYKTLCKLMIIDKKGKKSQTIIEPIKTINDKTILRVQPITGRTHQIRVHLKHIGHPIVNDTLYSNDPEQFIQELDNSTKKRALLHCSTLTIVHPKTRKLIIFEAPLPNDMKDI